MNKISKIDKAFIFGVVISILLLLLPAKYKMGLYTPNVLGYSWILIIILTIIIFIWASYLDLKFSNFKSFFKRVAVFLSASIIFTLIWFVLVKNSGNI